jgi:outer membrane protein assembly factor BamB
MCLFRRYFAFRPVRGVLSACLALALAVTFLAPVALAAADASSYRSLGRLKGGNRASFTFIFASDSHLGYGPADRNTQLALDDMSRNEKNAAFAIVAGDITETGDAGEYALFKQMTSSLPFPVMGALGNHESRWQDPQGSLLASEVGARNYSFDYGNWHFVVLDSTYPGQTLGTLEPATLDWLETDLRSQPKTKPVAVFAHHPLLYEPSRFQDSDDAFAAILDKYPVRAVFCAHGHSFITWKGQGRDFLMTGALMDGAYTAVKVNGSSMTCYSVKVTAEGRERRELLKVNSRYWNGNNDPRVSPLTGFTASYEGGTLSGSFNLSKEAEVAVRIDGGGYNPLGVLGKGNHKFSLDVSGHAKGYHSVRLRVETKDGPFYSSVEFSKDAGDLALWRRNLGSAVVGEFVAKGARHFIAGTRDGRVLMIEAESGSTVWEYSAGSPWGGGVIDGNRLYFGTAKGEVQCVNADTGGAIWRIALDKAGFAAPPQVGEMEGEKRVYIGSSSGALYCLRATTGSNIWTYLAGGAIASAPQVALGRVVFGAWDGVLYGVDEATGNAAWTQKLGRQMYYSPYLSPAIYNNLVFATTPYDAHNEGGLLAAFDVVSGQLVWKAGLGVTLMSPSISAASELVVPGANGSIYAFSPFDGTPLWRMDGSSSHFAASPGRGPEYVSGGYRGVVNFLTHDLSADYKVGDTSLFVSPLLLKGAGDTLVVVADSAGNILSLRFPK